MTDEKQTGARAAASEIVGLMVEDLAMKYKYHPDQEKIERTILQVEAIILKHCVSAPEDKEDKP